ncbi:hypothetical protein [Pseudonocardia sp. H11422]|uniref:hypothetical protein n=1 Tax=Pseudonocardia sp. H11422 TaxID=2835866 RepID=UPI0020278179|nr:hypothetical protein [Pseudonocardia sp. H11422]
MLADVTDHRPDPGAFDLVLVAYLQLPTAVLSPVLERAAEAVAPGGSILVVGHDRTNLIEGSAGRRIPTCCTPPTD